MLPWHVFSQCIGLGYVSFCISPKSRLPLGVQSAPLLSIYEYKWHGSFAGASRAMAEKAPKAPKRPEKYFVGYVKIGLMIFGKSKYGEGKLLVQALGYDLDSPSIKSAVENKKRLKSIIPELLGMKISVLKKVRMPLQNDDMKQAFGPIAQHYLPLEYARFCEEK